MENKKLKMITYIVGVLILIQALLFCFNHVIFIFIERTDYSDHVTSMVAMILFSVLFVIFASKQNVSLSVFPKHFNICYIITTGVAFILFILTPSNYTGDLKAIILLIYGSIVTPVFEEIIFRGYVWNRLNSIFEKEWVTYIVSTILFALWHIGYMDSIAFRIEGGLFHAIFWKVITGLCFGIVLGALRLKTKNSYSTMLLHGVMNIFGR